MFRRIIILFLVAVLLVVYLLVNPDRSKYFPQCPFLIITGLKCPGCGSQRAIHNLLNMEFFSAAKNNFLLVIALPYLIVGASINMIKNPSVKILAFRRKLMGEKAIRFILVLIISYWILRNVFGF